MTFKGFLKQFFYCMPKLKQGIMSRFPYWELDGGSHFKNCFLNFVLGL